MTSRTCPHCGSVIYSRRNVLCGRCGNRLPKELLFSGAEREQVEKKLAEAKQQARLASRPGGDGSNDSGSAYVDSGGDSGDGGCGGD